MNNVEMNNGKIIFISDLEGCAEKSMSGKDQSRVSCTDDFFRNLKIFLESNPSNKVAFLGDYFDKGNMFENNISHIINLYETFNIPKKRVYIILGNRDINKLRLLFEYRDYDFGKINNKSTVKNDLERNNNSIVINELRGNNKSKNNNSKTNSKTNSNLSVPNQSRNKFIWKAWEKFHQLYNISLPQFEKLKIIYEHSMGAKQIDSEYEHIQNYMTDIFLRTNSNAKNANTKLSNAKNANTNLPNAKNANTNLSNAKNANSIPKKRRENFYKLFKYGLIAEYDEDYKVLLSHAGGIGGFQFHTEEYYINIKKGFKVVENIDDYFHNIEVARRALMTPPSEEQQCKNSVNLKQILEVINSPLIGFMNNIFINRLNSFNPVATDDFFLLQALGLKPDDNNYFVSFVQSCDCVFCKGPLYNNIPNPNTTLYKSIEYTKFLDNLVKLDIQFVSFGHNPICTPVPIIYKRPESDYVIFIANDVSNGYRPSSIEHLYQIPLAYISNDNGKFKVGVDLFIKFILPVDLEEFKSMINEWTLNTVPRFNKNNKTIKYENNKLTFPARVIGSGSTSFLPTKMVKKNGNGNGNGKKNRSFFNIF
jgi:hypothetical protein